MTRIVLAFFELMECPRGAGLDLFLFHPRGAGVSCLPVTSF